MGRDGGWGEMGLHGDLWGWGIGLCCVGGLREDILLIIGNQEGSDGEGDYHADYAQQRAPDG